MESDQSGQALDHLIKEAEKREQQQKAAERWNEGAANRPGSTGRGKQGDQTAGVTDQVRDPEGEKPGQRAADHWNDQAGARREPLLSPEQRAERAELRKSIEGAIERLPTEKRDLLQNPDAWVDIHVPHGLMARPSGREVREVLESIPGIRARGGGIYIDRKKPTDERGATLTLDVRPREETEPARLKPAHRPEVEKTKAAAEAGERLPSDETMLPAMGSDATTQALDQLARGMRADKAEMRQSIVEAVARLPREQQTLLQNPDAGLKMHLPHSWSHRFQDLQDVLDSIPGIEASYRSIRFKEEIGEGSNRLIDLQVFRPGGFKTALRGEKAATEPVDAKPAADRGETAAQIEELADRAEMRESILAAIRDLPEDKRAWLKNPDAGFGMTLPSKWGPRFQAFLNTLDSIPEIKAKYRAFEYKEGVGQESNRIMSLEVYRPRGSREQEIEARRPPAETGEAKPAADRAESLSAEERAERSKIARPDRGVGCPYGGVPDRQSIVDCVEKRLSTDVKRDLKDPTKTVFVDSYASAPGDKDANKRLTDRRGKFVADVLHSLPEVKATIVVRSHGAEDATGDANRDNVTDRVVLIQSAETESDSGRDDPKAEMPGMNEVPQQYRRGYVMSQHTAEALYYQARWSFARGEDRGLARPNDAGDSKAHDADLDRYVREFQRVAGEDPHRALWDVKPWNGFLRDILDDNRLREPIRAVMQASRSDGRSVLSVWARHWIRRGAG